MTTTTTTYAVSEPTAWLRGRVGAIIEGCHALGLDPSDASTTIVVPLGRTGPPGSREDRSCDRCGTFMPPPANLYMSRLHPLPGLLVVGGLCAVCAGHEVGEVLA